MTTITAKDLGRLRHMLGAIESVPRSKWGYRNYYASPKSGDSFDSMNRLKAAGFVTVGNVETRLVYFHATEEGCKEAGLDAAGIKRAFED